MYINRFKVEQKETIINPTPLHDPRRLLNFQSSSSACTPQPSTQCYLMPDLLTPSFCG